MAVQPDVFGASFVREWGRIGFREQTLVELHGDEGRAVNPLVKLAVVKRKRGCGGDG